MCDTEETLEVIYELNQQLYEQNEKLCQEFGNVLTYRTDGYSSAIDFLGIELWSTEDDHGREYDEDTDIYENMKVFLIRQVNELLKMIGQIKLEVGETA